MFIPIGCAVQNKAWQVLFNHINLQADIALKHTLPEWKILIPLSGGFWIFSFSEHMKEVAFKNIFLKGLTEWNWCNPPLMSIF